MNKNLSAGPGHRLCFFCPVFEDFLFGVGQFNGRIHQIGVAPEKLLLPFLELLAGSELFADAERLGEDAVRADLHIRREEGVPVQVRHAAALGAQHVVDRPDQQREVVRPVHESGAGRLPRRRARIRKVPEGLQRRGDVRGSLLIEHAEQGFGLVGVGQGRVREHHKDLQNYPEVRADGVLPAGDGDGGWK